ncbi:MAG: AAA family ATPase [Chloroflexota bacterium]
MDDLLGRDDQSASIIAALSDATRPARSFLIEGEPGIGKTALVRFAMAEATARGYRVLETRPVEAEAGLALVGLGDLLGPVLSEMLPALPDPQRVALEIALLLRTGEGRAHDQRALGLAVLHGLQALSRTGPVVVVVDDAHWLDATTSAVLRFALRRLVSEPIVMLVARRPARPGSALAGGIGASGLPAVEHIELGPLSMGAVHRLVGDRLGIALSRPELRSIHGLSRGNPLYALELARGVRDGTVRPERDEISATGLETLVGGRIRRLPARSREVLATAAAASRPTVGLLERALGTPDVHDLLGPAARAGVVTLSGDEIEFDHPLLASAALAMLDGPARRACHARLAAVVHEPVEHARHLALAATEPDPEVAAQVEQAAMLTRARGAASGAADLMSLAIQLTASGAPAMPRRRLLEAEYRLESGDAQGAATMLERLAADTPPGPSRAVVLARLAHFHHLAADTGGRVDLLRQALLEAAPDDPIRGDIHEALAWALVLARYDLPQAMEHARAAAAIMGRVGDPNALAVAWRCRLPWSRRSSACRTRAHGTCARHGDSHAHAAAIRLRPTHANGYRLTCIDELDAADRTYAMLLACGGTGRRRARPAICSADGPWYGCCSVT